VDGSPSWGSVAPTGTSVGISEGVLLRQLGNTVILSMTNPAIAGCWAAFRRTAVSPSGALRVTDRIRGRYRWIVPNIDSPRRAGLRLRRAARAKRWAVVSSNWWLVALLEAMFATIAAILWVIVPNPFGPFLAGVVVASGVATMLYLSMIMSAEHNDRLGGLGEQSTAESLKRLRRTGWTAIHEVEFASGDIDHIVIGGGGVLVVESKWTTSKWRVNGDRIVGAYRDPVKQVMTGVSWVRSWLGRSSPSSVLPVIVVWGPGSPDLPDDMAWVGPALLLVRPSTGRWLDVVSAHCQDSLGRAEIEALVRRVTEYVHRRETPVVR
jgi:Nuclease-related domain